MVKSVKFSFSESGGRGGSTKCLEVRDEATLREAIKLAMESQTLGRVTSVTREYYSCVKSGLVFGEGSAMPEMVSNLVDPYVEKTEIVAPISAEFKIDGEVTAETDAQTFEDFHGLVEYIRLWLAAEIPNIIDRKAA